MEEQQKIGKNKITKEMRCSKCNSINTYAKKKGTIMVCRKCGNQQKIIK